MALWPMIPELRGGDRFIKFPLMLCVSASHAVPLQGLVVGGCEKTTFRLLNLTQNVIGSEFILMRRSCDTWHDRNE